PVPYTTRFRSASNALALPRSPTLSSAQQGHWPPASLLWRRDRKSHQPVSAAAPPRPRRAWLRYARLHLFRLDTAEASLGRSWRRADLATSRVRDRRKIAAPRSPDGSGQSRAASLHAAHL